MNKLLLFMGLLIGALYPLSAQVNEPYFMAYPALSPDGETLVFTYGGDLWKVASKGGLATRITAMEGEESRARISPDGQWVAFTGTQYNSSDIFIMPLEGGEIQQITFHEAFDHVESWSWDSQSIYFSSDRYNRYTAYKVNREGGSPERLFPHYFNTVHNIWEHPNGEEIFFNDTWESKSQSTRKRYRGPYNPEVKSYNQKTKKFKSYTDFDGKDFWQTIDKDGKIYFVSDENNGEYNLYTFEGSQKKALSEFKTSIKHPCVSANGSKVVFEKDYQLYLYNVSTAKSEKIPIQIFQNNTLAKAQDFKVAGRISNFDVSPDNKKLAFISRGELFVSDLKGKFVRQCSTNPQGRVQEVKWLKDNKTLIYNQTNAAGYLNWFSLAADGSSPEKQLTQANQNERNLSLNSDRSQGVYFSGREEVKMMDLSSLKTKTLLKEELWGFYNAQPYFSPDDRYIIFNAYRNFETDIFVYDINAQKTMNLSDTGVGESAPFWSPNGKHIYFLSNPVQPSYPRGAGDLSIFRMALDNYDDPYRSEKFEELFAEKAEEDKKEEKKEDQAEKLKVTINQEGLLERMERIGPRFGSQSDVHVLQEGAKTYVLFISNHEKGQRHLWYLSEEDFEDSKTEKISGTRNIGSINLVKVGKSHYMLSRGNIHKLNLGAKKLDKIDIQHTFRRNLKDEFQQMFYEAWAGLEENFYNESFHGIDWAKERDQYAAYLKHLNSRADLRVLFNDMLGELNSSHLGFYSNGSEESIQYKSRTLATGILFEETNPYVVKSIVPDSPADRVGVDIRPGDVLKKIDGQKLDPKMNREYYFSRPSIDKELNLSFERNAQEISVNLHPTSYTSVRNAIYDTWVDACQEKVDQRSNKRIAYVHMKNMGGGELNNFLLEMNRETYHRDALILDLRYNTGGNVHNDVLQFLSQKPYLQWKYREGKLSPQPNFHPASKPIVLLINEQSLSDAEMTAAGFKALGLGQIIGTETYRWIIFTSGQGLVDGSFYRLPAWGCYTLDGKNLEKTGVQPDIKLLNTFEHRLKGEDPQLERAIAEILKKLP